ncbi:MAG: sensor histidine kinase [Solirubrobacterales bacterium]
MNRVWHPARAYGLDALVLIAAGASVLEAATRNDPARELETSIWLAAPAIALVVLPLLARRRFPFAAPAAVWMLAAAASFLDGRLITYSPIAFIAGFVAAFLLGNVRDAAQARLGLLIVVAGAAIVVYNDPTSDAGDFALTPLLFAISWLAGFAMRGRVEQAEAAELRAMQAEREREAAARVAVAEERARIARELHDIVAHAVSVMVLQVGAVRHRLTATDPEEMEALAGVERTGRTALAEMRQLLGAMRHDGEEVALGPQPGLADLGPLLERVGDAGLPVELHTDGEPYPLPQALDLTAYRIVQEGLTNALKHARASHADVTVRYRTGELDIEIRDDGRGAAPDADAGHGLVGIRERVKVYGGELTAAAADEPGFVLRARLPLDGGGE